MPEPPASRAYRSEVRTEKARRTRRQIVSGARRGFAELGYAGTTMRTIAGYAGVSVATVELAFRTKAGVLKAAIDVAIAGDDEDAPVLERSWAERAAAATSVADFLSIVAEVLGAAQERSAALVLAAFEGAAVDEELAALARQLGDNREGTATWIVDRLTALADLRPELTRSAAVETVWTLMDPAIHQRLTRHRGWTRRRYQEWVARSVAHALVPDQGRTNDLDPTATVRSQEHR